MTFADVEKAREKYNERYRALQKKALKIYGVVILIISPLYIWQVASFTRLVKTNIVFTIMMLFAELAVPSIFYLIIALLVISRKTRELEVTYGKAYRAYFVERVMAESFTNLYYKHEEGLPSSELSATGLINTGDDYSSNDFTKGKYKNVGFEQADVHIVEEYEDSDGDTEYRTLFRGRFMIFEFPKKFSSRLMVAGSGAGAVMALRRDGMKRLKTESSEFNRRFLLLSSDDFEMFYLLDPAMMARMEKVADAYGDRVSFVFYENKLIIGINDGKDSFEPPHVGRALDEEVELKKNLADVKVITDLVDDLRLNK